MELRFIISSLGILFSFLFSGFIGEKLFKIRKENNIDFNIGYMILVLQYFINFFFTFIYNRKFNNESKSKKVYEWKQLYLNKTMIISSFAIASSFFLTLTSSQYLGYLFNTVLRSSKLLSILIGSLIFQVDKPKPKQFIIAIILTITIIIFQLSGVF